MKFLRISVIGLVTLVLNWSAKADTNQHLSKEIGSVQAIWMSSPSPDRKACEAKYLALLKKDDSPEAKYRVTLDLFLMFAQDGRTYADEMVKYARELLSLTPVPAEAAKAHDFIGSTMLAKEKVTDEDRREVAVHFITSLNIALKHLGEIRNVDDVPRPRVHTSDRASQERLRVQYALLEPLVYYRDQMPGRILGALRGDEAAMSEVVRSAVSDKSEASAVIAELQREKNLIESGKSK